MTEKITYENVKNFFEKWEKNKLKQVYKSEEIPAKNEGDVLTVVSKNYQQEIINNDKDVLIIFYATWCEHCKRVLPIFEGLAKKLKKNNPNLLFAKINAAENDVEGVNINSFPTIKFYPANKKKNKPIEFEQERTESEFISFLKKHAKNEIKIEEEKKTEKKKIEGKKIEEDL